MNPRSESLFSRVSWPFWNKEQWLLQTRVDKSTFNLILGRTKHLYTGKTTNFRASIPPEKKLFMTLVYIATGITMKQVAIIEGLSETSVHRAVHAVCSAITSELSAESIKMPRTRAELLKAAVGFHEIAGMPNIIGAVDGTHVKIRTPAGSGDMYYCRKGFPSVNVMVVSSSRLEFLNCAVGYSGRAHDSTVFMGSELWRSIQDPAPTSLGQCLKDMAVDVAQVSIPGTFIADSAYRNVPHLLPAFKTVQANTQSKIAFNRAHAKTRNPVERAIGRLKARFRKLLHGLELKIENCWDVILACILLHNICEERGLEVVDNDADLANLLAEYAADFPAAIVAGPMVGPNNSSVEGAAIRNALVSIF